MSNNCSYNPIYEPTIVEEENGNIDFLSLTDTPNSYIGQAGKVVSVKQSENGLEFISQAGGDGGSDANFIHTQGSASNIWIIPHGLNKRCAVPTVDSLPREFMGDVEYIDNYTVRVLFSIPISGWEYCN